MTNQHAIDQTKQVDVSDLVGRYVELSKASGNEWHGPCPKCGGRDRFHCAVDWWFCRQCHPKRDDAVAFVRWLDGCSFQDAIEKLTGYQEMPRKRMVAKGSKMKPEERSDEWFTAATALMKQYQDNLQIEDNDGATYLHGRGLTPATWQAFGLGYNPALQSVAIPWYRSGKITAIKYRFLHPTGDQKMISRSGSRYGGLLFGSQALPEWVLMPMAEGEKGSERYCTLVLCEGEINAMSIWQVAHSSNVHVVSVGSETGRLPGGVIAFAQRYGTVIIWLDKNNLVRDLIEQVPEALGYASPAGQDANDLLRQGKLGGLIVSLRWKAATTDEDRERLFYDLTDARLLGQIDDSSASAFDKIAAHLSRKIATEMYKDIQP